MICPTVIRLAFHESPLGSEFLLFSFRQMGREDRESMLKRSIEANTQNEYQRLSAMPIDMPPARFVAAEPGMSQKPRRS